MRNILLLVTLTVLLANIVFNYQRYQRLDDIVATHQRLIAADDELKKADTRLKAACEQTEHDLIACQRAFVSLTSKTR